MVLLIVFRSNKQTFSVRYRSTHCPLIKKNNVSTKMFTPLLITDIFFFEQTNTFTGFDKPLFRMCLTYIIPHQYSALMIRLQNFVCFLSKKLTKN